MDLAAAPVGRDENTTCPNNVTYDHRVNDPGYYNWCVVPNSGYDSILFAGLALVAACMLQGKFGALYVMAAGAALQAVAFPVNMGKIGNSLAIWLGIRPADILLYTFLPPMLLDAAVRVDFFLFQKVFVHVLSFAFLLVMASTAILVPVLLFVFDLRSEGWRWPHAALFGAILASTDAVAVSALLKSAKAPEHLIVILEGESLFNDATSIVLFQIFFQAVQNLGKHQPAFRGSIMQQAMTISKKIVSLAAGGVVVGFVFGVATRILFKLMHRRGHKAPEQLALTVAMAYLCFYVANAPLEVSGVIAVVTYGLYGCATAKWHMSARVVETGIFDNFWDTVGFGVNGLVFFFAGASSVNFFWRSSEELLVKEPNKAFIYSFWRLPLLWLALLIVRAVCIVGLNPVFRLAGAHFSTAEVVFSSIGGLRGAISLILAQMVVTEHRPGESGSNGRVLAQLVLWTAGVVVLTLAINAPVIPPLIDRLGLLDVPPVKARMRAKAARAVLRFSRQAVHDLQQDPDEMLRGVDWREVEEQVDLRDQLLHVLPPSDPLRKQHEHYKSKYSKGELLKGVKEGIKKAAQGNFAESQAALQPLLGRRSGDEGQDGVHHEAHEHHGDIPHAHDTDAVHAVRNQLADKDESSNNLDQLDVPFLNERAKKQQQKQQAPHDEENPAEASNAQPRASQPRQVQPAGGASQASTSAGGHEPQALLSPFSHDAAQSTAQQRGQQASAPHAQASGPRTHAPHAIITPCMVPPGSTAKHRKQPSVHWSSTDWKSLPAGIGQDRQRRSLQRQLSNQRTGNVSSSSMNARRQSESRMLRHALSGFFPGPAHSDDGKGEHIKDGEDEEEEELFSRAEMTEEARLRLVAGLKRYYHTKRAEGLLSARGMQLLDWACALQMDQSEQPLFLWSHIAHEACGHLRVRLLSQVLFYGRKLAIWLHARKPRWLLWPISAPLGCVLNAVSSRLTRVMLLTIEVAMEFWLSLQWSPQAQWLRDAEISSNSLRKEVKEQSSQVWRFILDREVEAPARFCAIQTHRASLAVLFQQARLVHQLYSTGMLDEAEQQMLEQVVEKRLRRLDRRGPQWRRPVGIEVLRGMPALQDLPDRVFDVILAQGRLVRYDPDQVVWLPPQAGPDSKGVGIPCEPCGIFVVALGLVKWTYAAAGHSPKEFFVGAGDVLGVMPALVGEVMAGHGPAVAVGNVLRYGPVVFHLPQTLIDDIRARARTDVAFKQLELDLHRVAALFVLERCKGQVSRNAQAHYQHTALLRTRKHVLRRVGALQERRLGHPVKAEEVWASVRSSEAAQKIVAHELEHALKGASTALPEDMENGEAEDLVSRQPGTASPSGPSDQQLLGALDAKVVSKILSTKAEEALKQLREGLRDARLVPLGPFEELAQGSGLVLLKGSLRTSGQSAAQRPPGRASQQGAPRGSEELAAAHRSMDRQGSLADGMQLAEPRPSQGEWHVKVQYRSPSVLPWLWEGITQNGDLVLTPQPIVHTAGPAGAIVLMCPMPHQEDARQGDQGSESSAMLDSRLQREAEVEEEGEGLGQQDATDAGYAVLGGPSGPVLARRLPSGGPGGPAEFGSPDSSGDSGLGPDVEFSDDQGS